MSTGKKIDVSDIEEQEHLLRRYLGPEILALIEDEGRMVADVGCNEDGYWWKEENHDLEMLGLRYRPEIVRQIINTAATLGGTVCNSREPILETNLPWGPRIEGMLPPLVRAPVCTIRVLRRAPVSLNDYLAKGRVDELVLEMINRAIEQELNILVCGTTGSGKTSFLDAMFDHLHMREKRIITIEETWELTLPNVRNKVRMRADPRGKGTLNERLNRLVRGAMRKRPDIVILGEGRGGEVLEWLKLTYAGHSGGMMTVHGDHPVDAMYRMELMMAEAVADIRPFRAMLSNAIHRIIWMRRDRQVGWKVAGIYQPVGYDHDTSRYVVDTMAGLPLEM